MGADQAPVAALEKAKADKEAHGEFVSECPGYCGAQDTSYEGSTVKHSKRVLFAAAGELRFHSAGAPRQPRIRWDLRSLAAFPHAGAEFLSAAATLKNTALC